MEIAFKFIENRRITADPEKCNGCLICQLRCSYRTEKAFNISKAAIQVDRFVEGGTDIALSFHEDCDACGVCARHCPYGALTWSREDPGAKGV